MKYNLLSSGIFIEKFDLTTNAVSLWISDIGNRQNELGNKKSKYLKTRDDGSQYFSYIQYSRDHPEAGCTISYPLSVPCHFTVTLGRIDELVDQICKKYREIYKEEEESKTFELTSPTLLNRGRSNGKYGIWGHHIGDLVLVGIILDTATNEITLAVDS